MKILHTADWHLGQNFFQYDRAWEHERFLSWLSELMKDREIDVLLISGDVFDTANPSAAAQKMYYSFITKLLIANEKLEIVVIAGNHDSALRLEAPRELLEAVNVSVRGSVPRTVLGELDLEQLVVPFEVGGCCLAVPYIRMGDFPSEMTYAEGVRYIYSQLIAIAKENYEGPIIAMGHLLTTGSELSSMDEKSRSERNIIGGLEGVAPDVFDNCVCYTALGHLHKAQRVSGRENVRYSGAPLPMSFAERKNKQGVVLVTIDENANTNIEKIEFAAPVKLIRVPVTEPKSKDEVIEEILLLPVGEVDETSPYIEVNVLINQPEPMLKVEIEEALKGKAVRLARMATVMRGDDSVRQRNVSSIDELMAMSPMEIAEDVFKKKFGNEMPEEMKSKLNSIIEKAQ